MFHISQYLPFSGHVLITSSSLRNSEDARKLGISGCKCPAGVKSESGGQSLDSAMHDQMLTESIGLQGAHNKLVHQI